MVLFQNGHLKILWFSEIYVVPPQDCHDILHSTGAVRCSGAVYRIDIHVMRCISIGAGDAEGK